MIGATGIDEDTNAVGRGCSLCEIPSPVIVVARVVEQHPDRQIEPHTLPDTHPELVAIVAALIAQGAHCLVYAIALRITHGAILIVSNPIPEHAHAVVKPHA